MDLVLDVRREAGRAVVVVQGEVDMTNAADLRTALVDLGDTSEAVVADLAGLEFIDSSGLSALLSAHRSLAERDSALELRDASPLVLRLLRIVGLDHVFTLVSA